ncbi:MAG: CoA pyrophosphatase [Caulobacteraceae bacterium]
MPEASRVEDVANRRAHAPAPVDALEARIVAALDPLEAGDGSPWPDGSDHDLNPELIVALDGRQSAAVLIPLIRRPEGLTVLLTLRADHMRRHAGQIAFPGGLCEPGETPWQAALREAHEEVGLEPASVRLAGLSTPYRTLTGYHITPVVGFVSALPDLTLNPGEVAETFEVPFAFLMDPANHERRHRDKPPGPPRWHYAITWEERVIWGATAAMLRALYERLERRDAV